MRELNLSFFSIATILNNFRRTIKYDIWYSSRLTAKIINEMHINHKKFDSIVTIGNSLVGIHFSNHDEIENRFLDLISCGKAIKKNK